MTMLVVGAGLGRTGTHTQKVVLERLLGGTCHHMIEVFGHPDEVPVWHAAAQGDLPDWATFLGGYNAIVDWPGSAFYRELADAFPDALVLLSTRDPDAWYRSADNTIFNAFRTPKPPGEDAWYDMIVALLGNRFCMELDNPEAMKAAFVRHNDEVRATIPPSRLLEWSVADGWEPLCAALGVPVPDEPFPVTNTTGEMREMMGLPPIEPTAETSAE